MPMPSYSTLRQPRRSRCPAAHRTGRPATPGPGPAPRVAEVVVEDEGAHAKPIRRRRNDRHSRHRRGNRPGDRTRRGRDIRLPRRAVPAPPGRGRSSRHRHRPGTETVSQADLPLADVTAQLSALEGRRLDAGVRRGARRGQVVAQADEGRDPPTGGRRAGVGAPRGGVEAGRSVVQAPPGRPRSAAGRPAAPPDSLPRRAPRPPLRAAAPTLPSGFDRRGPRQGVGQLAVQER